MLICNACTPLGKLLECCENLVRPNEEKKTNQKHVVNKLIKNNGSDSCLCKDSFIEPSRTTTPENSENAVLPSINKMDKAQQSSLSLSLSDPPSDQSSEIRSCKLLSAKPTHSGNSRTELTIESQSRAIIYVPRPESRTKSPTFDNKESQTFETTEAERISRPSQTDFYRKQKNPNQTENKKKKKKKKKNKVAKRKEREKFELETKRSMEVLLGPKLYKHPRVVTNQYNVSLCLSNNFHQLITYEPERCEPYPCLKSRPRCKIKSKEKDYPFLPFKCAPFIFYQICMIIDILMPYIAYVAMNESICKRNIKKFKLLTRMNNFLFHARQNLFKALKLYMGRRAEEALKIKFNTIWYCLEQAKTCANQLKVLKESQMFLPSSDSDVIIVILEEKKRLFKFLAKACSIQSVLPLSGPRKAISLTYIEKPATIILRTFKMDAKLMVTRPMTK